MAMQCSSLKGGQHKVLTPSQVRKIYNASLRILEKTGIEVHSKEAFRVFEENGARVDYAQKRVKIPCSMVEDAIDKTPSKVILCGREECYDLTLEDKRVYSGTGGIVLNVLDLETGEKRPSTLEDIAQFAKLVDALENIHFCLLPLYPTELNKEIVDVNRFYAGFGNTSKHIMGGIYTKKGMLETIKMAEKIAGGPQKLRERPIISFITCVMSPLKMDSFYGDMLVEIARRRIPFACPSEPLSGATAPPLPWQVP